MNRATREGSPQAASRGWRRHAVLVRKLERRFAAPKKCMEGPIVVDDTCQVDIKVLVTRARGVENA